MFEQLRKKVGRTHQATYNATDRPSKQVAPSGYQVYEYDCIPELPESRMPLKVTEVHYNIKKNTELHHTDMFEMTKSETGFDPLPLLVVRRGLSFFIEVGFHEAFSSDSDEILLTFQFGEESVISKGSKITVSVNKGIKPHNWSAGISRTEEHKVKIQVLTPADCIVGKCSVVIDTRKRVTKNNDKETHTGDHADPKAAVLRYRHNEPIYLLFNPWLRDDEVYLEDNALLNECILNDYGKIFIGNSRQIVAIPWRFAQFERLVLDCCLYLLDATRLEHTARGNALMVVRNIASLISSCDDGGVVLASWSGLYGDGSPPTSWVGSLAILEEFWKTKLPVGYGQCWVFSALATTMCRCLGIPTRCVTNYSSAHDCDGMNTINFHWNFNGEPIESMNSDSIWSFHVWNESYMTRSDLPGSDPGWQAFDPTPQEASDGIYCAGPCSVEAIKHGSVFLRFDGSLLFSELNTNRFHWTLQKDGSWRTILQKNITGKAIITYSPPGSSSSDAGLDYVDITSHYKFAEGTEEDRATLLRANTWATNTGVFDKGDGDIKVTLNQNTDVIAGTSFDVLAQLQNRSRYERNVKVTLTLLSTYYTGVTKSRIKSKTFELVLCPLKSEQISMRVLGEDYAYYLSDCATFKVCAAVRTEETDQMFLDCADFCLMRPKLEIEVPKSVQLGRSVDCTIRFFSQMPIDLTDCEWMVECLGTVSGTRIAEKDLEPYAQVELNVSLHPNRSGKTVIIASFNAKQLMGVYGTQEIEVTL